jgi:hypothetical protein
MADKNTSNETIDTLSDVSIFHYNIYNPSITKGVKNFPPFLLPQIGAVNKISDFSYLFCLCLTFIVIYINIVWWAIFTHPW